MMSYDFEDPRGKKFREQNGTKFDLRHEDMLTSSKLCVPVAAMSARRCFKNK